MTQPYQTRSPSLLPGAASPLSELDIYDKVEVSLTNFLGWSPAVITGARRGGLYDVQLLSDGTVHLDISVSSIRRMPANGEELLRNRQLGASFACEVADEDEFQIEAALFTSRVLKILAASTSQNPPASRKSMIRPRAGTFTDSTLPLLDRLLQEPTFPTASHCMRVVDLMVRQHASCAPTFPAHTSSMGTSCAVDDWCDTFASVDAMTALLGKVMSLLPPHPLALATVPPTGKFNVIGDTHGQLEDVLWVFFRHGFPSSTNVYLFNGDICDRGSHALEIWVLLFLFKWLCPSSIHITRGNHEDDYCNLNYGFCAELKRKFGALDGGRVHRKFLEVFYILPAAYVVDSWIGRYMDVGSDHAVTIQTAVGANTPGVLVTLASMTGRTTAGRIVLGDEVVLHADGRTAKRLLLPDGHTQLQFSSGEIWKSLGARVLVLHGGVPVPVDNSGSLNAVPLSEFRHFPTRQKIPAAPKSHSEHWMYQVFWSDPREPGETRGRGTPFYPADTEKFAVLNNLSLVIRSHQLPPQQRGYGFNHRRRLLTVFSASNYCGTSQNFGAVVSFNAANFPSVTAAGLIEHWAPTMSQISDVFTRHATASPDVKSFIAQQVEKAIGPSEYGPSALMGAPYGEIQEASPRHGAPALFSHHALEQRVVEYLRALLVKHRYHIWENCWSDYDKMPLEQFLDVLGGVAGWQFPWKTVYPMLDSPGLLNGSGMSISLHAGSVSFDDPAEEQQTWISMIFDGSQRGSQDRPSATSSFGSIAEVNYMEALTTFSCRITPTEQFASWNTAVVSGFWYELLHDSLVIQDKLFEFRNRGRSSSVFSGKSGIISEHHGGSSGLDRLLDYTTFESILSDVVSPQQIMILWVALLPTSNVRGKVSGRDLALACSGMFASKEHHEAIPELYVIRQSIAQSFSSAENMFFGHFRAENGFLLPADFQHKLHDAAALLRINLDAVRKLTALSTDGSGRVTFLSFFAALHADGSPQLQKTSEALAEHASACIYFHRVALRCACDALDTEHTGEIDRRSFSRALHALNSAVDPEWRLLDGQLEKALHTFGWEGDNWILRDAEESKMGSAKRPRIFSLVTEQPVGTQLWVSYEDFIRSFDIVDKRKMSRAGSFGWGLLRESIATWNGQDTSLN